MRPGALRGEWFGSFASCICDVVSAPVHMLTIIVNMMRVLDHGRRAPVCCDTVSTRLGAFTCAAAVVRLLLPGLCAPLSCSAVSVPASRGSSDLANARDRSDAAILLAEA